ncbi:MAG: endonuclease V [Gaiellaceae bacterium]
MDSWPGTARELIELQRTLGAESPPLWRAPQAVRVGACYVCFERGPAGPGKAGDEAWAAASLGETQVAVEGIAQAPYQAGLLALREGALLESAVRALPEAPDVVLVDATGRDHPRRAGLALQLGAVLGLASVGVTHRPLIAAGEWPADEPGARSPLLLDGVVVGYWLRTRPGHRPLAVHAAWRTDPDTAVEIVLACRGETRTPQPLRQARRAARTARARASTPAKS